MKFHSRAILLLAIGFGCSKSKQTEISGHVINGNSQEPVGGAKLHFSYRAIGNATFSSGYTDLGTAITLPDGTFRFAFDAVTAADYRVLTEAGQHFSRELIIQRDEWTSNEGNELNIRIFSRAMLTTSIVCSGSGKVLFRLKKHSVGCAECCDFERSILINTPCDTSFQCSVYGHQIVNHTYTRLYNNISEEMEDSTEVGAFEGRIEIRCD